MGKKKFEVLDKLREECQELALDISHLLRKKNRMKVREDRILQEIEDVQDAIKKAKRLLK